MNTTASATHDPATFVALDTPMPIRQERQLPATLDLEVFLPAYNEQDQIGMAVSTTVRWLRAYTTWNWRVTVVDNASTDQTLPIAQHAAEMDPAHVGAIHLDQKGRGRALTQAWLQSRAAVVAYMDVDLSTDLSALPQLVDPLLAGEADLAIGSRLLPESQTMRCLKREFISRSYNALLNASFRYGVHDAQCGFKAMRANVARRVLPSVRDTNWFWDTELLVVCHAQGLRIREVPVIWVEDPGTTVDIPRTVREDLAGIRRMRRELREGWLDPSSATFRSHAKAAC